MSIVKLNNQAVKNATSFGSISSLGSMVFIKKLTASSSATLSFVDGSDGVVLDNSYKEYLFTFKDIHAGTDNVFLQFNGSIDSGSNYNVTKTTTTFQAQHLEDDSGTELGYVTSWDLAQSTASQYIIGDLGNGNDESGAGTLRLFNPSSTTFVKHFIATSQHMTNNERSRNSFTAGYLNTTSAVDAVIFQMSSGNIDSGDICLYGIA